MAVIVVFLARVALLAFLSQIVLLVYTLVSGKQQWYHSFSPTLIVILAIGVSQNLVQAPAHLQDLWKRVILRGELVSHKTISGRIDQACTAPLIQVAVLLALAAALFVLQRVAYPHITLPPIRDFAHS
jgi:hypothetical protein